ncbi:hypothetical protein [Pseudooceanicola sp.]|uniref:hypothetical protein n=1 Tax=Pseudooceanicola sp. TaxID=1914328 RepID=UPI004058C828
MFANLILSARLAAQRAAFNAFGAILLLIGIGFLTVAAWIGLAAAFGTLTAALVIGCVFVGLGLLFMAMASIRRPLPPAAPAPAAAAAPVGMAGLVGALVQGIGAGIVASAAMRKPPPPPPPPAAPPPPPGPR